MKRFLFAALLLAPSGAALALTDEIQVYTGDIAAPGVFNLTLHSNYTPDGLKTPDFPAGLADDKSYSGVAEWAYGVTPWFEAGLYLPLYAVSGNRGAQLNGFKLRALFVNPDNATSNFYYGVNFEFSNNSRHWDENRLTGEIRPILGYRLGAWSLTFNPILDNSYKGISRLDFAPATRLDYAVTPQWTVALEEYDDFGELRGFMPAAQQSHQLFAVVDHAIGPVSVEAGAGFGLTSATDALTFKLILTSDLNGPDGLFHG
jgi:opacity protein-like surface antigen